MATVPLMLITAGRALYRALRAAAYEDMARIAQGWIPEEAFIEPPRRKPTTIKLDFTVPKKHRLLWARRCISQLPH